MSHPAVRPTAADPSERPLARLHLLQSTLRAAQPARARRFPSAWRMAALAILLLFIARLAVPLAEMVLAELAPAAAQAGR